MIDIRFATTVKAALKGAEVVAVLAPKGKLDGGWHRKALGATWAAGLDAAIEDGKPGDNGNVVSTYSSKGPRRLLAGVLPDTVSRHNAPSRSEAILNCVGQFGLNGKTAAAVIYLDESSHALAAAVAVARALPTYDARSRPRGKKAPKGKLTIVFVSADGSVVRADATIKSTVSAVRFSAELVDTPPDDMTTAHFEKAARAALRGKKGVRVTCIRGDALQRRRMGGIYGVGRAATTPPRLLILDYRPAKAKRTIALVGKGIVYDTGGLSLKVGGSMPNMKCDMGGAAAVLGAFIALAETGCKDRVVALCCLAENAIGQKSYRPDDVLKMHSGKTVEINNTDAEGRLVLADGVSYAGRDIKADLIIDAATLTGAALIATGRAVSCTVSNRAGLERLSVECGRATGDLTHPLLFTPEFMKQEFKSKIADMRNSVADRMNAQTSAAAQFIYNHIEDLDRPWVHLDIAGPAFRNGRGTGHGAALIAAIVRGVTKADLAE